MVDVSLISKNQEIETVGMATVAGEKISMTTIEEEEVPAHMFVQPAVALPAHMLSGDMMMAFQERG